MPRRARFSFVILNIPIIWNARPIEVKGRRIGTPEDAMVSDSLDDLRWKWIGFCVSAQRYGEVLQKDLGASGRGTAC